MKLNEEELLKLYPDYTSVLGPYKRKDNRKHIVLNNSNLSKGSKGKTKTISYPKALVESNSGKRLLENETVDHDDRNFENNSKANLIVKDRSIHSSEDALRVKVDSVTCPMCNTIFVPTVDQRNDKKSAGPFCTKSCSGKYSQNVQGGLKPISKTLIAKQYYRSDK